MADEALIRHCSNGDSNAFACLYDRHAQTVYSLLVRIVRDRTTADELLQETFWQMWQKADQYRGRGAVAAWLYRIARNKALDHLRRRKSRPHFAEGEAWDYESVLAVDSVEKQTVLRWNQAQVRAALARIPEEQRRCLELAYFDGLSQREIAERMETPLGTVKTRVRMGLEKLERFLRAEGYREDDV